MDAIKNDIYLSTIFNACEEKVLTYEELLQKVNLYTKKENFDEETLNYILEEVEKFRIHKKSAQYFKKRKECSSILLQIMVVTKERIVLYYGTKKLTQIFNSYST